MSIASLEPETETSTPIVLPAPRGDVDRLAAALRDWFGVEFSVFHGATGETLRANWEQPSCEESFCSEMAKTISGRVSPEFIGDEDPVLLLAMPIPPGTFGPAVAIAAFVTRHVGTVENLSAAARLLDVAPKEAAEWINRQTVWTADSVMRLAKVATEKMLADVTVEKLTGEIDEVSNQLSSTYEEISLLYGITQNVRLSSSDEELGHLALDWLAEVVPAEALVLQYLPVIDDENLSHKGRTETSLLVCGDSPIGNEQFSRLVQSLELSSRRGPLVANQNVTRQASWAFPDVRQLIVVPLAEADNVFGWLAAVNHRDGKEFGTIEGSLLYSVGAILGIHSGNIELYRQQAEFVSNMVRALTSAIDAKDPYTCGHSDRVARVAVRLAQELDLSGEEISTIYMGGLLHDIGKIGIDDNVLRKPGRLTDGEYEHIKLHPGLGYKILRDLQQLGEVLPVVHHHHEHFDGTGYPHGLKGEAIPLLARIAAVADAFDAMSSDRPYRQGMQDERVNVIFRDGSGRQWDPRVVDAFFRARKDIDNISSEERSHLDLNVMQWT